MSLHPFQQRLVKLYADGEFDHVTKFDPNEDYGDGLFRFLLIELSTSEGCETIKDARDRLSRSIEEISIVLESMRDFGV